MNSGDNTSKLRSSTDFYVHIWLNWSDVGYETDESKDSIMKVNSGDTGETSVKSSSDRTLENLPEG